MVDRRESEAGWNRFLTQRDKEVFQAAGFGSMQGLGERPALLVTDVVYGFIGEEPAPILESIQKYPNSCGKEGWDAIPNIEKLLQVARQAEIPIIYTIPSGMSYLESSGSGRWSDKRTITDSSAATAREAKHSRVVAEVAPDEGEIVIVKSKPSAFFGTQLAAILVDHGADSVIVCGCTTSGCVRATVVDAFSFNFRATVASDATFDRGESSHWISLFDLQQKYADVLTTDAITSEITADETQR